HHKSERCAWHGGCRSASESQIELR
ncbi:MAG: hypothetical protein EZS28_040366, partial [Streblomastix strix]